MVPDIYPERAKQKPLRVTRIELAYRAWEARVLPLNYTRLNACLTGIYIDFPAVVKRKIPPPAARRRQTQIRLQRTWRVLLC
jgi:hypothetical protein